MPLYGYRGRIGFVVPDCDYVSEYEYNKLAPPGVAFYFSRMMLQELSAERILKMAEEAEGATERLPKEIDLLVYHCTSGSFMQGPEWEADLLNRLSVKRGVPTISTMVSVIQALRQLDLKKIALATPYVDSFNIRLKEYLEKSGITVVNTSSIPLTDVDAISSLEQTQLYRLAKKADAPEAEGIFLACTGLKTMGILDEIEEDLGKPVISSNSATLWHALRRIGVRKSAKDGYGRLHREF